METTPDDLEPTAAEPAPEVPDAATEPAEDAPDELELEDPTGELDAGELEALLEDAPPDAPAD